MADPKDSWRTMRAMRANPPGLAGRANSRRREVFQAGLAQAEELWEAARVTGPASRPLPLFYCLSQAGRALCAAWLDAPSAWQPRRHGLTAQGPPAGDPLGLVVSAQEDELGAFGMVAAATESPSFDGGVSLAELWASLPHYPGGPVTGAATRYRVLRVAPGLGGYLDFLQPRHARLDTARTDAEAAATLADFPTVRRIAVADWETSSFAGIGGGPILTFPDEHGEPRPLSSIGDVSAEDRSLYFVRPRIGNGEQQAPPSQFMTQWALLFGMSVLARYHPETWVKALNVDRSTIATSLEHGMEVSLRRVPELLNGEFMHRSLAQLLT
jgi:YaaC-like Protein